MSATWVDTNTNEQEVEATEGNDTGTGSAMDDVLNGLGGDDKLFGNDGNDQLFGGEGDDTLFGGQGNDLLDGGRGNDQLVGDSGNDTLHGGEGNDVLVGGEGDDKLIGDTGRKNFIQNGSFEKFSGGDIATGSWRGMQQLEGWKLESGPQFEIVDAAHGKVGATDGEHWLDTDASPGGIAFSQKIEGLEAGDSYELNFDSRSRGAEGTGVLEVYWNGEKVGTTGGTFADGWKQNSFELTSGSGDGTDTLRFVEVGRTDAIGTALDNVQLFSKFDDTLVGGAGNDELHGGDGNDRLDGGAGLDTASYSDSARGIVADITTGVVTSGTDTDTLVSIERIQGSAFDDVFAFANPTAGATYAIEGGAGYNTVDLSKFPQNSIRMSESQAVVTLPDGKTFKIEFSDVDYIKTANGGFAMYDPAAVAATPAVNLTGVAAQIPAEIDLKAGQSFSLPFNLGTIAVSDAVEVRVSGLPAGATLSAGRDVGQGEWVLKANELPNIALTTNSMVSGNFDLKVTASVESSAPLYSENFETGAKGWNVNTTEGSGSLSQSLGRFGGTNGQQGVFKTFAVPAGVTEVVVEFDMLEIDSWDGEKFQVFGNDKLVTSDTYQGAGRGIDQGSRFAVSDTKNLGNRGYGAWEDQRHSYRIVLPVENGMVKLGFGSTLNQGIADEAWAIDNLVIQANNSFSTTVDVDIEPAVSMKAQAQGDLADGPVGLKLEASGTEVGTLKSVRIENVPASMSLSAGTKLANGSWQLTPEQANNLQANGELQGSANLTIKSTFETKGTLYSEDFEKGASGWSSNAVTNGGASLTNFLGRFNDVAGNAPGSQSVFKTFDAPPGVTEVQVQFDFLELDSWDGEQFRVFANDKQVSAQTFFTEHSTYQRDGDKANSRALDDGRQNKGFSGWADQRHRYTITVPVVNGQFKVGFGSTLDQGPGDEAWGVDNVKVTASQTIETTTSVTVQSRQVLGTAGNDTFVAGTKAEAFVGKDGIDTVDYSKSAQGVTVKLDDTDQWGPYANQKSGGLTGDAAGDTYKNVENVIGSSKDDYIFGAAAGSNARLGDGNDVFDNSQLADRVGVDVVDGGAGNDTVWTGHGNDTLIGGSGNDNLFGEDGNDTLTGGSGNDFIDGGTGNDVAVFSGNRVDYDVIRNADGTTTVIDRSTADGVDRVINVESLRFADQTLVDEQGSWTLRGAAGNDNLVGTRAADTIDGGLGNDNIRGGAGNDVLRGGGGADTVSGGDGDDTIASGSANDTAGDRLSGDAGNDRITGSSLNDIIDGGSGNDQINSGSGDDVIFGDTNPANLPAGSLVKTGDNLIVNGSFETNLTANRSWNVFNSADGWRTASGAGIEIQEGVAGTAADGTSLVELDSHNNSGIQQTVATEAGQKYELSVQYSPRPGVPAASNGVEVWWNGNKIDTIVGEGVGLRDTQWRTLTYQVDGNGAQGAIELRAIGRSDSLGGYVDNIQMFKLATPESLQTGNDTIDAGAGNDRISGQGGNDTINAGSGDDTIDGGTGNDVLVGGMGNDFIDGGEGFDRAHFGGNATDYEVTRNADGSITVKDMRPGAPDGIDRVVNTETLAFADSWLPIDTVAKTVEPVQLASTTAEPNQLTVRLGGEMGNNAGQRAEPPRYEVWANGQKISTGVVDWATIDRMTAQGASGFHELKLDVAPGQQLSNVSVRFTNDAYEGKAATDRNMYVDAIEVNGKRFEAEGPSTKYHRGGDEIRGQEGMYWSGTMSFNTSDAPRPTDAHIAENVPGAVVGKLATIDSNTNVTVSDDRFEVKDGLLKLKDGVSLNYEQASNLDLKITGTTGSDVWTRNVQIEVDNVNEANTAVSDSFAVTEDGTLNLNANQLLGNDTDLDGDKLRIVGVSGAENGTVKLLDNGQIEFKADANYSGPAKFSYTVTDAGGLTSTATIEVNVGAVADAANVTVGNVLGLEDQAIKLDLAASLSDIDGSETMKVAIKGVPEGFTLSAGTRNADGSWSVAQSDLGNVSINAPKDFNGQVNLTLEATTTESSNGETAVVSKDFSVNVNAVADAANVTVGNVVGLEDQAIKLDLAASLSDIDGSETMKVEIKGVPEGFTLSAGTRNADGSWSVAQSDLGNVSINAPKDFNGQVNLTIEATTTEASKGEAVVVTKVFSVDIADINDNPFDIQVDNTTIVENAQPGEVVAKLSAGDIDDKNLSFRVVGDNAKSFVVVGDELRITDQASFSYADRPIEKVTVEVSDGRGGIATREIEIAISANSRTIEGTDSASKLVGTSANDTVIGGTGDDSIDTGRGDDKIDAGRGNNVIDAGAGNDSIDAGAGDDVILGGSGADSIDGGEGEQDVVLYNESKEAVVVDLEAQQGKGGDAEGDTIRSVEGVVGSSFDDTLIGDKQDNLLVGNAGNDQLAGGAGNDLLVGGEGDDQLDGGDGTDVAKFSGNMSDYRFDRNADGQLVVTDLREGSPDGVDRLVDVEMLAFADTSESVGALFNSIAVNENPTAPLAEVNRLDGSGTTQESPSSDTVRGDAEIGQTVRDLESLASELNTSQPIQVAAPEYMNPNQYITLPPIEKIDWSKVTFNDLVELNADSSYTAFDTNRTDAKVSFNRSGESNTAVDQENGVAAQGTESSTLSKLWALVRAYGGLRQK